jgi:trans-2,3-dihydro-3-hydroxyanthranilate isomerase
VVSAFNGLIVDACVRDGTGGSPTAVVDDDPSLSDEDRRRFPGAAGTSHAALLSADGQAVRFFTAGGELTGCGHGTVAAQAVLLHRSGRDSLRGRQLTGGRGFDTVATRTAAGIEVWFDQGVVELWQPSARERDEVLHALGAASPNVVVASPGAPRYLVEVPDVAALSGLTADLPRLAGLGVLGCFAYALDGPGRAVARMFAPAIGVPEDIANANSTGCLAAHLRSPLLRVDQGDARGCPSTVLAAAEPGPDGIRVRVGGVAVLRLS